MGFESDVGELESLPFVGIDEVIAVDFGDRGCLGALDLDCDADEGLAVFRRSYQAADVLSLNREP